VTVTKHGAQTVVPKRWRPNSGSQINKTLIGSDAWLEYDG